MEKEGLLMIRINTIMVIGSMIKNMDLECITMQEGFIMALGLKESDKEREV